MLNCKIQLAMASLCRWSRLVCSARCSSVSLYRPTRLNWVASYATAKAAKPADNAPILGAQIGKLEQAIKRQKQKNKCKKKSKKKKLLHLEQVIEEEELELADDELEGDQEYVLVRHPEPLPKRKMVKTKQKKSSTPAVVDAESVSVPLPTELPARPDWDRGGLTKSNALTPLLATMRKLIDANKGCVCLVQVGSFYELYFEQAVNIAPKLGIKVATRKTTNHLVPMAGFPVNQLQKFVKILVHDLHMNVAIVDQHPAPTEMIMHRKVSRIVTPGTLIDESFLNYSQNNYLVGIHIPPNSQVADPDLVVGLLWMDVSVGEFFVQQTTMGEVAADLKRISPSEIILPKEYHPDVFESGWINDMADLNKYFVRYHKTTYGDFKLHFRTDAVSTRKTLELFSVREEAAMNLVLSYVNVNLPDRGHVLEPPQRYIPDRYLHMDSRTRDALELTSRSTFDTVSVVGSLLNAIKRTVTPSGTRLLTQWLKLPIVDVDEITWRQQFVSLFVNHSMLRLEVRRHLGEGSDFARSVQRLALRAGLPVTQLQAIGEGLDQLGQLQTVMKNHMAHLDVKEAALVQTFLDRFNVPTELGRLILDTLHTEPMFKDVEEADPVEVPDPESTSEGPYATSVDMYANTDKGDLGIDKSEMTFYVRKDHNSQLLALHAQLESLQAVEDKMLQDVREKVASIDPKASVAFRAQYGRLSNVIQIGCRLKFADQVHAMFGSDVHDKRKTSLVYKPMEWETLQDNKMSVLEQIGAEERSVIAALTQTVLEQVVRIRNCGRCADILDITASFAVLAEQNNMVCPRFTKTSVLNVTQGRHAVVESSLKANGQMFNDNDTRLGTDGNLWVISGPNMGGKSTFLRQNALIVVLAQIGSFVPASSANLGIVDRIFTRIGASDDIFSDLSTFMVEMVETSNILKNATPRSLAIVDEIGRGTSGDEGLAIAYSTLVTLLLRNKCRTLFATHFGRELKALLDLEGVDQRSLRFFRTKIVEVDTGDSQPEIRFDHSLEPGISDRSYAIEVARLAGFPRYSLDVAKRAFERISKEKKKNEARKKK